MHEHHDGVVIIHDGKSTYAVLANRNKLKAILRECTRFPDLKFIRLSDTLSSLLHRMPSCTSSDVSDRRRVSFVLRGCP